MLKLVIFDMDGLMLDTERSYLTAFSEVCARYGLPDSRKVYLRTIGLDDKQEREIYRAVFPHIDADHFCAEVQVLCAEFLAAGLYAVKSGLFELLDAIDRIGHIRKAVVTSNLKAVSKEMLARHKILERLDGGVYRDMITRGKPAPDGHLLCCRMFPAAPREALVLEDSEAGLRAALAAGIPAIAVPDLLEPPPEVLSRCLARCDGLVDVIPYLGQQK
jgi:beta-phosphoglucomutase-like phosphatase (HAD superfamily)